MQLRDALCYAVLTMTMAATCIQAESKLKNKEELLPAKIISRRIATLVIDDATPIARVFQQPKVIYRRLSKKSYTAPKPTYGRKRTKYGPPRTAKRPGKKYRGKNGSKHAPFPYPYKKRAPNPRPPKRPTMNPVYGPPKKNHRIYNGIGFGEPPSNFMLNKYRSPKPSKFTRPQKPDFTHELTPKPHVVDFSSPATFSDNFSNRPFNHDDLWSQQQRESESSHLGYGEPPVDSYGAPIKPNLLDLTISTAQSFLESTSHLDEDRNFGPQSRPWYDSKDQPENNYAYSIKHPILTEPEEKDEIFVTPVPEKPSQEMHLNSYSDIYNYRQEEKKKEEKKKKMYYQKNVKMINHPWVGAKMKNPEEEIIIGGQYAEPPARYVAKFESDAPFFGDDRSFSASVNSENENDMAPISSYVNYKNSNMAFSPQNLNDAFSIVDK